MNEFGSIVLLLAAMSSIGTLEVERECSKGNSWEYFDAPWSLRGIRLHRLDDALPATQYKLKTAPPAIDEVKRIRIVL